MIEEMQKYTNLDIDCDAKIASPKYPDIMMQKHYFSVQRKVSIDECPQSGGIWLDPGELLVIRETYPSEEEREQAAHDYIQDILNNSNMTQLRQKSEADLEKARSFAKAFRFICPSHYLPGKQDWGAF